MRFMGWLPGQDSNLGQRIQSPLCYHYTTGQSLGSSQRSGFWGVWAGRLARTQLEAVSLPVHVRRPDKAEHVGNKDSRVLLVPDAAPESVSGQSRVDQ